MAQEGSSQNCLGTWNRLPFPSLVLVSGCQGRKGALNVEMSSIMHCFFIQVQLAALPREAAVAEDPGAVRTAAFVSTAHRHCLPPTITH